MPRTMLIVNESELVRKILTSYVLAEMTDILVETAASAQEGLDLIKKRKFDVVLAVREMSEMDGYEFHRQMQSTQANKDTPFIMMAGPGAQDEEERLAAEGIEHYLSVPYTALDLARTVNQAINPRSKRVYDRFSIPDTDAVLYLRGADVRAKVLNISRKGALCELDYQDDLAQPMLPHRIDVIFPDEYGRSKAENILAAISRVEVITWRPDHVPHLLRIAWKFIEAPEEAQKVLKNVLKKAGQDFTLTEELFQKEK